MAEKIANEFKSAIAKGYVNIFILSILEREKAHGYKIKKDIENMTFGIWVPADSTIYTDLKKLTKGGLITFQKESIGDKARKVYELTAKGRETLSLIKEHQHKMKLAMGSMMGMFSDQEKDTNKAITKKNLMDFMLDNLDDQIPIDEKKAFLLKQKKNFSSLVDFLSDIILKIDVKLSKIKSGK